MTYFLFGTLWSVLFWAVYTALSLFITIRLIKMLPRDSFPTYGYITKGGESYSTDEAAQSIIMTGLVLLLWPVIISVLFIYHLFSKLLWPSICKVMVKMDREAPTITFNEQKEDKK